MIYAEETLTEEFIKEIYPLLVSHYNEIAYYKDIELKIDWEKYFTLQTIGCLRIVTARDKGQLIGYAVYFVSPNMHYLDSIQATQDILFILPHHRGKMCGVRLITKSEEILKEYGVEIVHHHVKIAHDFSPILDKLGYALVEKIHSKRLL